MNILVYIFSGVIIGLVVISIFNYFENQNQARRIALRKLKLNKDNLFLESKKPDIEKFSSGTRTSAYHFLIKSLIESKTIDWDIIISINKIFNQILTDGQQSSPNFKINYPEDLNLAISKKNAFFIGQYLIESAHNAIEHSFADFYFHLVTIEHNSVNIICHDNGQGFDPKDVKTGRGIKLMKESAHLLSGDLKISSVTSVGTKTILEFSSKK